VPEVGETTIVVVKERLLKTVKVATDVFVGQPVVVDIEHV
jgi:hypothetical protein